MALTDPENIPSEIRDQIEAASFDLAKGLAWVIVASDTAPPDDDPALTQLAQGYQRALTAIAMMVITFPAFADSTEGM